MSTNNMQKQTGLAPESLYYRIHRAEGSAIDNQVPLVFLHGLMGFSANWGKIWPYFFTTRPVLVLDQRGHGRSEKPAAGYSPMDYSYDLKNLLDYLQWEKVHLVGHSMGGRVALYFAHLFPDTLASLTMEDSGAKARPERIAWIKNLLGSIPTPFSNKIIAQQFFNEHFTEDILVGKFLYSNIVEKTNGQWDWRFKPENMIETIEKGRAIDAMEIFKKLSLPTLLIRGEKSEEFNAKEAEEMKNSRKNVKLVTIPGASHFVHTDKPKEYSIALSEFIKTL